jgi:hypothetical protein
LGSGAIWRCSGEFTAPCGGVKPPLHQTALPNFVLGKVDRWPGGARAPQADAQMPIDQAKSMKTIKNNPKNKNGISRHVNENKRLTSYPCHHLWLILGSFGLSTMKLPDGAEFLPTSEVF